MSKAIATVNEYRNLPLAQLQESPTNPRRRFDEHSLNELAASFAAQGVLQPLLVRAVSDDKYEVIAGARRLRAAKLAALRDVPVRIVALSDSDCVVAQLVENIQREGVHPMEEALAFDALLRLESPRYDVAAVAQKAGKSPAFVLQRQRLVELMPSIAEAFLADQIGVGHALEIAKLPQSQQERVFDAAFRSVWYGGKDTRVAIPLRDFTVWIEQNILLSLDAVPFDKADATLVPEAGSCADCRKRTGFNTLLFGDMGNRHDCCSDAGCFNHKLGKFVEQQIAAKPELVQITTAHGTGSSGILPRNRYIALQLTNPAKSKQPLSPYQKPCKHMAGAIVVDGVERGRTTKICAEPTCAVHFPDRRTPDPAQLAKEREQRRKELEKRKLETTIRHRTLAEVLRKVATFGPFAQTTTEQWRKLMGTDLDAVYFATREAMSHLLKTKGSIVNLSSVSGLGGDWGLSAYNAAKGAITNFTHALALEYGSRGVRVNAVAPSLTSSEATADLEKSEAVMTAFVDRLPIGRAATPDEIAGVIAFLASEDAVFVNGVILPVDGGLSASNGQPNFLSLLGRG